MIKEKIKYKLLWQITVNQNLAAKTQEYIAYTLKTLTIITTINTISIIILALLIIGKNL